MAQNNNQQQQNTSSAFEKEDAYRSLEMVNTSFLWQKTLCRKCITM